jgi:hypothetical protein
LYKVISFPTSSSSFLHDGCLARCAPEPSTTWLAATEVVEEASKLRVGVRGRAGARVRGMAGGAGPAEAEFGAGRGGEVRRSALAAGGVDGGWVGSGLAGGGKEGPLLSPNLWLSSPSRAQSTEPQIRGLSRLPSSPPPTAPPPLARSRTPRRLALPYRVPTIPLCPSNGNFFFGVGTPLTLNPKIYCLLHLLRRGQPCCPRLPRRTLAIAWKPAQGRRRGEEKN